MHEAQQKMMIRDLKEILDEASYAYYNTENKTMSDEEFDNACETYYKLSGKKYNTKTKPASNKRIVNVDHTFENLLGTIDNKFQNMNDFEKWLNTIFENIGLSKKKDSLELLVSEKYDGNSVAIEYENGKCIKALTRGENGQGADLTDVFKSEKLLKSTNDYIGIRYEVMISYDNYNKLNEEREKEGLNTYVNSRSTVAGLLGKNDAKKYHKYLTLVPLSLRIKGKDLDRYDELEMINKYQKIGDIDFTANIIEGNLVELIDQLEEIYQDYINKRESLPYMIDGLVIELVDTEQKKKLGYFATGSPKWSSAIKFPHMEKTTVVKDIVFEASPNGSGKITPSAIYEPVYFNGAKMEKTSLANYKRFKELKLGKGSKVMIEFRNDCLCYLSKLDVPENKNIRPIPFTDSCPICGGDIRVHMNEKGEETFAYCDNPDCEMKIIGKINNYTTQLGIKGIELSTLTKLYENDIVTSIPDLYDLDAGDIAEIDGLGMDSAMNIIQAINECKPNDYDILAGLSIPNVGKDMSKNILQEITFDELTDNEYLRSNEFKNKIQSLDGVGPIMSRRLTTELPKYSELLKEILKNVNYKASKKNVKLDKSEQLIFVHTGDTDPSCFKDRKELKEYIGSKGHKMTGSVSGKTNYLITETPNSGTKKNEDARRLNVKIITCKELVKMLN